MALPGHTTKRIPGFLLLLLFLSRCSSFSTTWPASQPRRATIVPRDASAPPSLEWEDLGGNFVLRPPDNIPVRAVVHFLGGAFVGAAPHVTYRYLLYGLAQQGYLVVTTPYRLGFDYLEVCDSILECFERAAVPLAKQYGALPVVGMGHSCGALLQVYITCLFPDTPRAANALISFNNKPVSMVAFRAGACFLCHLNACPPPMHALSLAGQRRHSGIRRTRGAVGVRCDGGLNGGQAAP